MIMYSVLSIIITLVTISGILFINAKTKKDQILFLVLSFLIDIQVIWLLKELKDAGIGF